MINPVDAKARGIEDGDIVKVFNERGACLAGAVVTEDIRERTIYLCTGSWYDPMNPSEKGSLDKHGNPNVLTHDKRTSKLSQSTAAHSALVNIAKFEGDLPEITVFDSPEMSFD